MCLTGWKSWMTEAPASSIWLLVLRGSPLASLVVGKHSISVLEVVEERS
jgi:hypothetical protein